MVVDDAEELTDINNDGFSGLMLEIRSSIEEEMATLDLQRDVSDVDLEALIEESIAQHQGNISFIDDKLANRNQQLNQL